MSGMPILRALTVRSFVIKYLSYGNSVSSADATDCFVDYVKRLSQDELVWGTERSVNESVG